MKKTTIKELRRGDFFALRPVDDAAADVPERLVWVRGDYDRSSRTYECFRFSDVNLTIFCRPSRAVYTDFDF